MQYSKFNKLTKYSSLTFRKSAKLRILQQEINNKYTIKNLLEKIQNFKCTHETGNLYKFIGYKPEIQFLNKKLSLNMDKKYDTRENIKKILKY